MTRKILVTSALPYANGSIHLGHLVEYIQTDIWVRFQKMRGNQCYYMCADDTHGTPIMLSARKHGIEPTQMVESVHQEHFADFKGFNIEFDNYYTTNSPENKELSEYVYLQAKGKGKIYEQEIEQYYCNTDEIFLPDRMIEGVCPNCQAENQYGDSCEVCSATYSPTELIEPACTLCGSKPVLRKSNHHYFKLSDFEEFLKKWVGEDHIRLEIRNKLNEWFERGLKDWDISRDEPYFGFKIPGTEDKYFYVWMDAPIGYMATTKNWCDSKGFDFDEIWRSGEYELHHFIGKDILYFHTLFWPAMLDIAGFKTPDRVNVHGFLTVNGEKMSKSRGTFIKARTYLDHLDPELLRYYYAAKLGPDVNDIDLNMKDFVFKVNSDVVGKVVNIGSRVSKIVTKSLGGKISAPDEQGEKILAGIRAIADKVAVFYEELDYGKAMKEIMLQADIVNKYINDMEPWSVVKEDEVAAASICATALNSLFLLTILLKPVLPKIAEGVETFLNVDSLSWDSLLKTISNHQINPYQRLAERIDNEKVAKILVAE